MPTFLQPVELPAQCFLQEVLYWVAFQRLPIATYTPDGEELRDTYEVGGYAVEITVSTLSEDETARAGIPPDPDASLEERTILSVAYYDKMLLKSDLHYDLRRMLEIERKAAVAYENEKKTWLLHYERAVEYPASKIFVALRNGSLRARGINPDLAQSKLKATGQDIFDLPVVDILPAFWSLQGIDFDASAVRQRNRTLLSCFLPH